MHLPEPEDYLGKTLAGKYHVEELIGEGGMGRVFRARQAPLDRQVVLKILRHSLLSDARTVARFQREARAASRLNHPNSIAVIDFGQADDGALFIAMEYVKGRDLHDILSHEWPLAESRVVRIVAQVLAALSDAHRAGVIHRDLKPENIMVEQRPGEPDCVKVLDFGIAKIMDAEDAPFEPLTRAGFVCGTPEYMAPEQARGAVLDPRADLYAVGVILYQLSAGVLPFEADSALGFAKKHVSERPLPPSRRRPEAHVSAAMEHLIMRALEKAPDRRPATAELFRADLLAVTGAHRLAPPRHPTPTDQQRTQLSPSPAWGAEPTLKTAAPASSGIGESPAATLERRQARPLSARGRRLWLGVGLAVCLCLAVAWLARWGLKARGPGAAGAATAAVRAPVVPAKTREPIEAARLALEGDAAHLKGHSELARKSYEAAFAMDPSPELALKLGELHFHRGELELARRFWGRHLRAREDSSARAYIIQAMPELAQGGAATGP